MGSEFPVIETPKASPLVAWRIPPELIVRLLMLSGDPKRKKFRVERDS